MPTELKVTEVKTFRGNEGQGFNATLWIDGVKACLVDNATTGGDFDYTWLSLDLKVWRPQEAKLNEIAKEAYIKEHPGKTPDANDIGMQLDIYIEEMVNDFLQLKSLRRRCKKEIVGTLPSDKPGQYGTWRLPFTPENKAKIEKANPGVKILNDHLDDGEWKKLLRLDEIGAKLSEDKGL